MESGIHWASRLWVAHGLHQLIHWLLKNLEKRLRIKSDPESHDEQRREGQHLTRREVMQLFILWIRDRPEEYSLVEPQKIRRRKNYAGHRPCAPPPVLHEGSLQDGELADEAVQQRQSHRGE